MALFGQISAGAGAVGSALAVADSLLQSQISIEDIDGKDSVFLNVTDAEALDLSVNITEHPVADAGAISDYVSRNSVPLSLTCVISNKNLDLRRDPIGAVTSRASAFAPGAASAIKAGVSVASKFFDLGADEMTRKLQLLYKWQNTATLVKVKGLRLDLKKIRKSKRDVFFLIQGLQPTSDTSLGDAIGLNLTLKHMIFINAPREGGKQGIRGFIEKFVSIPSNPFA